jgi:hypothetical protein
MWTLHNHDGSPLRLPQPYAHGAESRKESFRAVVRWFDLESPIGLLVELEPRQAALLGTIVDAVYMGRIGEDMGGHS